MRTRFLQYVFHALPILSRSCVLRDVNNFIRSASTGLLAGLYAMAIPFTLLDDKLCVNQVYSKPDPEDLWRLCYRCLQREMQFPQLSTIQISLLLLNQIPPDIASYDTPALWSLASSTLALAQSLGLHIDPESWKLPAWEIRLRRRLWWSVVNEHVWRALTHGRPLALHHDDWSVANIMIKDFHMDAEAASMEIGELSNPEYFVQLCTLTMIAADVCAAF